MMAMIPISFMFIIISVIVLFVLNLNNMIDAKKFVQDTEPYLRFLMEDDYEFLLRVRYGDDIDVNKLFSKRVQTAIISVGVLFLAFLSSLSFLNGLIIIIISFGLFKLPYIF